MTGWRCVIILLLGFVLVGSVACNPFGGQDEEVTTQLVEVVRGDLAVTVSGSGRIEVAEEAKLSFGSSGKIEQIHVDRGDKVSRGEVLAELDTGTLELALTQAQLAWAQALVTRDQALVARDQALVTRDQALVTRDQAEYDLNRLKDIIRASGDRIKIAESYLAATESQIVAAESQIVAAELQIEAAELQIETSAQAVAQAQKQLNEATITAPFDGVVASVDADEGDSISTVVTIIHLIDLTTVEVKVEVDEIDIPDVRPGQRAVIDVDALPAQEFEGEVISIAPLPVLEAGVVSYEVVIGLNVSEDDGVRIGMSVTADIVVQGKADILLLPSRAVTQDSEGNFAVKVMDNEQVKEKPVVIGISDGFQTEIVDGLDEGEVAVIERRVR